MLATADPHSISCNLLTAAAHPATISPAMLLQRPRLRNWLHILYLANPNSGTYEVELAALVRYASGKRSALEIGTFEAVSTVRIVQAMAPAGVLHCVDPWLEIGGKPNPCWRIAQRHLRRSDVLSRVRIHRDVAANVRDAIPTELDFAFIDGDHSRKGIETDWAIVAPRIQPGGIVCLHDSVTPASEPWRMLDSVKYFAEVIAKDPRFEQLAIVHSLAILQRR